MILRIFTLILEPENPVKFSVPLLHAHLTTVLNTYTSRHKDNPAGFLHRYPAVQCKSVRIPSW